MGKVNQYVFHASDTEGEMVLDGEYISSTTEKAAWSEALKRAFLKISADRRQGFLVGSLAEMRVTRTGRHIGD
jgi:hypothetical protein